MTIIINPGSGPVETDLGFQQAYNNILQFIKDCEIPLFVEKADCVPEDGRYFFILKTSLINDIQWEVEMPALPIEKVRYMGEKSQNIWNFPRLYIDGSSWVWAFAIIKKTELIEHLQACIEDNKASINNYERMIQELEITHF